jgi:hypothetical protein
MQVNVHAALVPSLLRVTPETDLILSMSVTLTAESLVCAPAAAPKAARMMGNNPFFMSENLFLNVQNRIKWQKPSDKISPLAPAKY